MTHFKTAHGQVPIADSPLYRITIWIFNCLFIRVFRSPIPSISPGSVFGPILLKAFVLATFLRFRSRLGPHFKVDFPAFSGADSLEGDFDEGNLDHGNDKYDVVVGSGVSGEGLLAKVGLIGGGTSGRGWQAEAVLSNGLGRELPLWWVPK
jgi:hypothetical protein